MLNLNPPDYHFCPICGQKLNSKVEEGKKRLYCPENHWTFYPSVAQSATAVILNGDTVLLVKRKREPYQGSWMFPAGFVEYGEHPKDTIVREALEETGLNIQIIQLIDILQSDDDPRSPGHFIFFYLCTTNNNPEINNNDSDENSELSWFPIDKLPPISWHAHQIIASKIKELVNLLPTSDRTR